MAAPGLYGATGQMDKLDVSDVLAAILLKDTATLGQIAMSGSVSNIEHFWFEDSLNDAYVSMSISIGVDASTGLARFSGLSSSASVLQAVRPGSLVRPEGYNIVYQIVSQSTDTSINPYASTTAKASAFPTAISNTATRFLVVGMPKADTATYSDDISRTRTRRKNYTQVFERGIQIAETREHIDVYGVPDELKLQIKNRTYEIKRELNNAVVNGVPYWTGGAASPDIETRSMSGIVNSIRYPALDSTASTQTLTDAANGALTLNSINDLAKKIYDQGGFDDQSNCCIIVGPYQARVIGLLEENRIRTSLGENTAGSYKNKIVTDLGFEMNVVLDRWMPPDLLVILDKSRAKLMPLSGDSWHMEKMAKTSRVQGYQLSGQYTMELRNPDEAHGMIYRLAWS
jgi:hypothetical protein